MAAELKKAASVDFDGVIFSRIPIQFYALLIWAINHNRPSRDFTTLPDRTIINNRFSLMDHLALGLQRERKVKPQIGEFLTSLGVNAIFGNTGRSNNQPWVEMTTARLKEGGIYHLFTNIYYKPKGISSDESKYWALREIKESGYSFTHWDDNAYTVKLLASEFPDDQFIIVQDLTSGILFSAKEMEKYPNVKRMAMDQNGSVR